MAFPCFLASVAQSYTAVICGTPTPATTLVVQIDPGPMPTFTTSAPASISAFVPSAVATFPAIIVNSGKAFLISLMPSKTPLEWPCAVSITIASTWDLTSSSTLLIASAVTPTAAPTSSLPCASFAELGNSITFSISLIVIRPFNTPSSLIRGNFSILCFCRIFSASSNVVPTGAVTKSSLVITSLILMEKSSMKRKSLFVKIPTNF
ncbi:hypothetical protein PF011_g25674 [Phytophthora fragariae]|uniref:Uncharacterized protein n=1 Tax=Phytophthora fragariae TaxID=53985 RepID=A0A6A3HX27_9STRA|nr:hypothetical protein PF011_g25674 [Phytophthora fragariae]